MVAVDRALGKGQSIASDTAIRKRRLRLDCNLEYLSIAHYRRTVVGDAHGDRGSCACLIIGGLKREHSSGAIDGRAGGRTWIKTERQNVRRQICVRRMIGERYGSS